MISTGHDFDETFQSTEATVQPPENSNTANTKTPSEKKVLFNKYLTNNCHSIENKENLTIVNLASASKRFANPLLKDVTLKEHEIREILASRLKSNDVGEDKTFNLELLEEKKTSCEPKDKGKFANWEWEEITQVYKLEIKFINKRPPAKILSTLKQMDREDLVSKSRKALLKSKSKDLEIQLNNNFDNSKQDVQSSNGLNQGLLTSETSNNLNYGSITNNASSISQGFDQVKNSLIGNSFIGFSKRPLTVIEGTKDNFQNSTLVKTLPKEQLTGGLFSIQNKDLQINVTNPFVNSGSLFSSNNNLANGSSDVTPQPKCGPFLNQVKVDNQDQPKVINNPFNSVRNSNNPFSIATRSTDPPANNMLNQTSNPFHTIPTKGTSDGFKPGNLTSDANSHVMTEANTPIITKEITNPFNNFASGSNLQSSNPFANPFAKVLPQKDEFPTNNFMSNNIGFNISVPDKNFVDPEGEDEGEDFNPEEEQGDFTGSTSKTKECLSEFKNEFIAVDKKKLDKLVISNVGDTNPDAKTIYDDGVLSLEERNMPGETKLKTIVFRNKIGTILFQGQCFKDTEGLLHQNKNGTYLLIIKGIIDMKNLSKRAFKILKFGTSKEEGESYLNEVLNKFLLINK